MGFLISTVVFGIVSLVELFSCVLFGSIVVLFVTVVVLFVSVVVLFEGFVVMLVFGTVLFAVTLLNVVLLVLFV